MQFKVDFSRVTAAALSDEKRLDLISFRVTEKFKAELLAVANAKGKDLSGLLYEYAVKGYLEDLKEILLVQMNGNVTVRDLLPKG